jgi:hypothetical protein
VKIRTLRPSRDQVPITLAWQGDHLIDVVGGEASVGLDGTTVPRSMSWAYPFDRALVSAVSGTRIIYQATGTKGLVAKDKKTVRELNRSYYHANAYEYPVALGRLSDGREVIAHCPDGYNQIVIEVLATGERLASASETAVDLFHSRLSFSPTGRYLLSAGWVWHPYGVIAIYDVDLALRDSTHLDGKGIIEWEAVDAEVEAACWTGPTTVFISGNPDEEALNDEGDGLRPGEIGLWSLDDEAWLFRGRFAGHTGTVHSFGDQILSLYEHPKLIDPLTLAVMAEWPELESGEQKSSIIGKQRPEPFALDEANRRFAVANYLLPKNSGG